MSIQTLTTGLSRVSGVGQRLRRVSSKLAIFRVCLLSSVLERGG